MSTLDRPDFDEYIERLSTAPIEEIVETVANDIDLRGYLSACAGTYANEADTDKWNYDHGSYSGKDWDFLHFWETSQFLVGWTWKDMVKFEEEVDRKSIAYWAPKILRCLVQRMKSAHSQQVKKELEQHHEELEKKRRADQLSEFMSRVPKLYRNASIHDFSSKAWQDVIKGVDEGHSYLIYGGNGIGKTHFGYAVSIKIFEEGGTCEFRKLSTLLLGISALAQGSRMSTMDIIDMGLVRSKPILIIDECDKIDQKDTAFRNFSYLIDRRYEEQLQTILLCNADNADDLRAKLGSSICDRFTSKKWKADVVDFCGAKSRREAGTEKPTEEDS